MASAIQQTDDSLPVEINKAGCLFISLLSIVQWYSGRLFTSDQILTIYKDLVDMNTRSKYRGMGKDCWVANHEDVINAGLDMFGHNVRGQYVEKISYHKEAGDSARFKNLVPTYFIRHYRTTIGNGHFVLANEKGGTVFDPYFPWTHIDYKLSFRTYTIK